MKCKNCGYAGDEWEDHGMKYVSHIDEWCDVAGCPECDEEVLIEHEFAEGEYPPGHPGEITG